MIHRHILKLISNRGFTLIELLVVISIIGMLASVVLASLSGVRSRARDSARIQGLVQLRTALELYRTTNGYYPKDNSITALTTAPKSISAIPTVSGGQPTYKSDSSGNDYILYDNHMENVIQSGAMKYSGPYTNGSNLYVALIGTTGGIANAMNGTWPVNGGGAVAGLTIDYLNIEITNDIPYISWDTTGVSRCILSGDYVGSDVGDQTYSGSESGIRLAGMDSGESGTTVLTCYNSSNLSTSASVFYAN
ncbi:MAG: prepilin-type N-terminal cleavage/methylation domain-containing protein [Candidatus Taylorbacteria bacterium]